MLTLFAKLFSFQYRLTVNAFGTAAQRFSNLVDRLRHTVSVAGPLGPRVFVLLPAEPTGPGGPKASAVVRRLGEVVRLQPVDVRRVENTARPRSYPGQLVRVGDGAGQCRRHVAQRLPVRVAQLGARRRGRQELETVAKFRRFVREPSVPTGVLFGKVPAARVVAAARSTEIRRAAPS